MYTVPVHHKLPEHVKSARAYGVLLNTIEIQTVTHSISASLRVTNQQKMLLVLSTICFAYHYCASFPARKVDLVRVLASIPGTFDD